MANCAEKENLSINTDRIECYGFCGKKFHFSCIAESNKSYKKKILSFSIEIPNFQWYCNDCIPFTINGTYSGILHNLNSCVDMLINSARNNQNNQNDNGSIPTPAQLTISEIE